MNRPFRDIIGGAFNRNRRDQNAFIADVRQRGREYGLSPMMILALLRFAIFLWDLWSAMGLVVAPLTPVAGEPDIEHEFGMMPDERHGNEGRS